MRFGYVINTKVFGTDMYIGEGYRIIEGIKYSNMSDLVHARCYSSLKKAKAAFDLLKQSCYNLKDLYPHEVKFIKVDRDTHTPIVE